MDQEPIFVTGFSRGGTTMLMNLLASHPQVCTVGETHQLFKGSSILDSRNQVILKSLARDLPLILATRQDFLSPRNIRMRPTRSRFASWWIRRAFEASKRNSRHEHLNQYKSPTETYSQSEIDSSQMLAKNLDGTVLVSDLLRKIYPNCRFVGMTRHGLAVCEGHLRRGRTVAQVGEMYATVADKIIRDSQTLGNYQLVRFEDLIANPIETLDEIFVGLGLDPDLVDDVRLQERKLVAKDGQHRLRQDCAEWDVRWLSKADLPSEFDQDVNKRQIERLSAEDRREFLSYTEDVMEQLGYDVPNCDLSQDSDYWLGESRLVVQPGNASLDLQCSHGRRDLM